MDTENLTPEQEAQIAQEFADLSGISDETQEVQEVEEEQTFDEEFEDAEEVDVEETEAEEADEEDSDTQKESKTEKKIKKLLSKKNKAEREKATSDERIAELERKLEINEFIEENPDAKSAMEDIQNLMEEKWYDMADAYAVLKARGKIKTKTPSTKGVGQPKQWLWTPKDINNMNTSELESMLKADPSKYLI